MERPLRGIALLLGATAKYLTGSLPPIEIAWLRYIVFTLLAMLPIARFGLPRVQTRRPIRQILRGVSVVGSAVLFILALSRMPISQATTLSFMSPLLIVMLSAPLLGETVGLRGWLGVLAGFIGVVIVVRPGTGGFQPASLLVVGSALFWSAAMLITKQMAASERASATLFWTASSGLVVLTVLLPFTFIIPSWRDVGLALLIGLVASAGQWLTLLAYRHAPASVLAPLSYLQLIWSTTLGYLVFHTVPDRWTLIGAVIIASSGLYTVQRERARLQTPKPAIVAEIKLAGPRCVP
jgi:drug/metabolite transporter (DMT)-like permease